MIISRIARFLSHFEFFITLSTNILTEDLYRRCPHLAPDFDVDFDADIPF